MISWIPIIGGISLRQPLSADKPFCDSTRDILLTNFDELDFGEKKQPKRLIDSENPLNLVNYYGYEDITLLWQSIPENQRPYTIILLIASHVLLPGNESRLEELERNADICEENRIPYAIQCCSGETHMEERPPIAYMEQRFAQHEYFYGLNCAELYNAVTWRGESESDNSLYIMQCIKLCAKYGAFFLWTDTNMNYDSGMVLQWFENNESFYDTFKQYSEYICLINKESYGKPSSYACMQGLWLAGLVGNWGVASDWWHWQVDGDKKSLFGEFDRYVDDEWDMILSYPESMYVQSMMLALSRGGTCFKAEAPNFSTSVGGVAVGGFAYGISPLLDRIIDGRITIPSKQQVLAATDYAVIGGTNFVDYNYNYKESNLYPATGCADILVLLPKNLRLAERAVFLNSGIKLIEKKLEADEFDLCYPADTGSNTYLTNTADKWYYINNVENKRCEKYARFAPNINSATGVYINAAEHTGAIITESADTLNFYLSNYRTDKSEMVKQLKPSIRREKRWEEVCAEYLPLDENGNPIGVDDSVKRKAEIVITGTLNGGKPEVEILSEQSGKGCRPFTVCEEWNAEKTQLKLIVMFNGTVELAVALDSSGKTAASAQRQPVAETKKQNLNYTGVLQKLVDERITDSHNYTYYSYLLYDRAVAEAQKLVTEKTGDLTEIASVTTLVQKRLGQLIRIEKYASALRELRACDDFEAKADSFDALLRELLSTKEYISGRTKSLQYFPLYWISPCDAELNSKSKLIERAYQKVL